MCKLALIVSGLAVFAAGHVLAADAGNSHVLKLNIPATGTLQLTVQQVVEKGVDGQSNRDDLSYIFEDVYTQSGDGYSIQPTLKSVHLNNFNGTTPPSGVDVTPFTAAFTMMDGVGYSVSSDFAPLKIDDMPKLKANYIAMIKKVASGQPGGGATDAQLSKAADSVFAMMTPGSAASTFLPESVFLSWPHNTALELGKPQQANFSESSPLGGVPIETTVTMTLTGWDEAKDEADLSWESIPDPASLTAAIQAAVPKMMAQMQGQAPDDAEMQKIVAAAHAEMTRRCTFQAVISTGLVRQAKCSTLRSFSINGHTQSEKHDYILSEALVTKP